MKIILLILILIINLINVFKFFLLFFLRKKNYARGETYMDIFQLNIYICFYASSCVNGGCKCTTYLTIHKIVIEIIPTCRTDAHQCGQVLISPCKISCSHFETSVDSTSLITFKNPCGGHCIVKHKKVPSNQNRYLSNNLIYMTITVI